MSDYKIDKNIPYPKGGRDGRKKYPFDTMEVGDSFHVPNEMKNKVSQAASLYGKKYSIKFSVKQSVLEGEECRCWRIE